MTERRPRGLEYQTWIDRQIERARERGEFDELPGHGEPIEGLSRPRDENWWVKQKLRSENLSYLPPALELRKQVAEARESIAAARSEAEVRRIVEQTNDAIRAALRTPQPGPPIDLAPMRVERVLRDWRRRRRPPGR